MLYSHFTLCRLRSAYGARTGLSNLVAAAFFAIAASPLAAEPVTIVALGDSLTQGYGLPEQEGFVPQLQAWLDGQGAPEARIVNAGVSGDTTAGGLARVDWALEGDTSGVIVALGGNDLLRGLAPSETRANLDGILTEIGSRGLPAVLIGLIAPDNYGADYKASFDAIFPDLAAKHGAILVEDFFAGLSDTRDTAAIRALMQPDGIHPNEQGVERIVGAVGPSVLDLVEIAQAR